ncbi:MAG: 50S ribosomal protein L4 [Candidatus Micrarchaeaceae archaeon]
MEANVYKIDGTLAHKVSLPELFGTQYNKDIVLRALLAEQSRKYQQQGRDTLAGMRTSATYVGRYNAYRTLRHMGVAIRPRQKLAKGAMGEVRRIPSARKGRRAHPSKVGKIIEERINRKEYNKALLMAIAATANKEEIAKGHVFTGSLPIVVEEGIERIAKTKELYSILKKIGIGSDLEKSHKPRLRKGLRRLSKLRHFRNSAVIIAKDANKLERAGRNIPGIDVVQIDRLSISKLAPGGIPRLAIWTEPALNSVGEALAKAEGIKR